MPLIRFQVRNEFRLGDPELHRGANKDDPKAILDGLAVAGLVGILRQLGDLAEFAAEVFQDMHEQIMTIAARSHKIVTRVQRIETALPNLEKSMLAQTSHIHFAYTAGSDWHVDIQTKQNHLLHSDLPHFILDSYEECRGPPRLSLLDKFDAAGVGACMRRYSDPSFFKTAWASSEQVKMEKIEGDKKAGKSKRKGSRRRSGELRHAASISQRYSRFQFVSPDTDEPADTGSSFSMRSKTELANQSPSFDSEPGPSYVERIHDANSSIEAEEFEQSKLSTTNFKAWYDDACAAFVPAEQSGEYGDVASPDKLLQGHAACGTSSVTWDEKTEIVRPVSPQVEGVPQGQDQVPESLPESFDQPKLEEAASSVGNVDQEDIVFEVENIPQTFPSAKQFEELTSETDNYTDALNNIESEIETDSDCQTKRELELESEDTMVEPGAGRTHEVAAQNSESYDVKCPIESFSSLSKEMDPHATCSVFPESMTYAEPPEVSSMPSSVECSINRGPCEDVSSSNGFGSTNDCPPAESSISASHGNKIMDDSCISQESPKNSGIPSVMFWTNGGLLGLEPSKPPDFVVSNPASQNSAPKASGNTCNLLHHTPMPNLHHDVERSNTLVKPFEQIEPNSTTQTKIEQSPDIIRPPVSHNLSFDQLAGQTGNLVQPEYSTFQHDKQDEKMSVKQNSKESIVAVSEITQLEKLKDPHPFSHPRVVAQPVISNTVVSPGEVSQNDNVVPSGLSGITQRFLSNGLAMKALLVHRDSDFSEHSVSDQKKSQERPYQIEQNKWQSGIITQTSPRSGSKEQTQFESYENLASSPPLEHMKLSFHPINGMETSKLKLEFPNGPHRFHEGIQDDMFPSFQLLPEPNAEMQDMGSESDDDTFYRSSLYPSDDLLSLRSDSSSEHWESAKISGSNDDDIYDALRRVPSAASISGSLEMEGMNHESNHLAYEFISGIGVLEPGPLRDLPSFDATISTSSVQQKVMNDSEPKDLLYSEVQYSNELPPPPPLPPLQWRMMRTGFALAGDKQQMISEGHRKLNDLQVEISNKTRLEILQPTKPPICDVDSQPNDLHVEDPVGSFELEPVQPNGPHNEELNAPNKCMKLDGNGEPNQSSNSKELDERGDLLQQIRAKSFNLRRTAPKRSSSSTSEPVANTKVSAILEKANAIRQAFAGGDDDNWSDG